MPRLGAPGAPTVELVVGGGDYPMAAAGRRLVDGGWRPAAERCAPARSAGRDRLRLPAGRRPDRPARPAVPPATRRGRRADPHVRPVVLPLGRRGLDRAAAGRQPDLRAAHRHLHPGGHPRRRVDKLDHLVSIGVDMVELLPVNGFTGTHNWGYDGVLWFAVQESYGGPRAYQRFVDACHQRGHRRHPGRRLQPPRRRPATTCPLFGPYLNDDGPQSTWGESHQPGRPRLRRGAPVHPGQRRRCGCSDYHVDGLRLDAVHALVDSQAVHLLEEHRHRGRRAGRRTSAGR